MRIALTTTLLFLVTLLLGCEGGAPAAAPAGESAASAPPPPEPAAAGDAGADTPDTAPGQAAPAPGATAPAAAAPAVPIPNEGGTSEKAAAGVGAKGRDYGGPGFVTTPIETLFRIEDRIVFEAQIPNNMKIYKAEHNNKGPKDQEEFMQVIIADGGITLPELPAGDVYWYDPKTEELLVRHPKQ